LSIDEKSKSLALKLGVAAFAILDAKISLRFDRKANASECSCK